MIYLLTRNGRPKRTLRLVKIRSQYLNKLLLLEYTHAFNQTVSAQLVLSHVSKFIITQGL